MVLLFSILLMTGICVGQAVDLSSLRGVLGFVTSVCLAFIMMEVGLDFSVDQKPMRSYRWDFIVAVIAAGLPALLWFVYFVNVIHIDAKSSMLSSLASAPTSAGVLLAMLLAGGLGGTWVFKKARTLAVLDDLVTILFLTPLQVVVHGFQWDSMVVLGIIVFFLYASFRWQNALVLKVSPNWILVYAFIVTVVLSLVKYTVNIHLEVLIPAFTLGCLIRHTGISAAPTGAKVSIDTVVKGLFMLLVGLSFPRMDMGQMPLNTTVGHVLMLTLLSNIGKAFPLFCYRREASLKERVALAIAMFPRGEVGAAVLIISIGYGLSAVSNGLAMLSLALNLVMTGIFIWLILKILKPKQPAR